MAFKSYCTKEYFLDKLKFNKKSSLVPSLCIHPQHTHEIQCSSFPSHSPLSSSFSLHTTHGIIILFMSYFINWEHFFYSLTFFQLLSPQSIQIKKEWYHPWPPHSMSSSLPLNHIYKGCQNWSCQYWSFISSTHL